MRRVTPLTDEREGPSAVKADEREGNIDCGEEESGAHQEVFTSLEHRLRRAAQLRSEAASLDGEGLSERDFHILNGSSPTRLLRAAIWKRSGGSEREFDALDLQQRKSYEGFAPENELARARARQMILLETATTGALQSAANPEIDIAGKRAYMELALRCIEAFNKLSDRFERARGLAQQQIFVQHNRFDPGSQAVLQNVQTERIEGGSSTPQLLNGLQTQGDGGAPAAVGQQPSPSRQRRKRSARKP